MLDERRKEIKADPKKFEGDRTALTMLVQNKKSESDPTPFFSNHLSVSTCIGFLNGAFDTTHSTSFWIFYHLAKYPEQQQKLTEEINKLFVGDKQPTIGECRDCPLLDAWIKESMRLRPTVPIGMRVPDEDVTIGGVHIPGGTTMLPYLDYRPGTEKYFGAEPDKFRPERFLGDSKEAATARSKWDRFGGFARMCVGMTFAQAELRALIVWVLKNYAVELADPKMPEPEMIYEAGVYQPKDHFHFSFKKR